MKTFVATKVVGWTALLLAAALGLGSAHAQSYPDKSKPIRMIVPFNAGTSTDALGRAMSRAMADQGLNVVVENVTGAEGALGARAAKQAAPDGYTFLVTTISTQATNPHMIANLPYDPLNDYTPLVGLARAPLVLYGSPTLPFKTTTEFVAAAKANPGKYTFGSASGTTRMAGEMFGIAAGAKFLPVPYKSFSDLMNNLISGEIHFLIADPGTIGPFVSKGVRPLGSVSGRRVAIYPNMPTVQEEGVGELALAGWWAAYFPAKTPAPIAESMRNMLNEALKSKYVQDVYAQFSYEPLPLAGEELDKFQRSEYEKWGKAVRAAGLGPAKQ